MPKELPFQIDAIFLQVLALALVGSEGEARFDGELFSLHELETGSFRIEVDPR